MIRRVQVLAWLRPSRSVPVTRWRADSRWSARPTTFAMLILGLALFGIGDGLLVMSGLGVSPWTVLAQGLSVRLPLTIGAATLLVSTLVLILWIPLRERPGLGTISNIIVIASALQVTVWLVPQAGGSHPYLSIDAYLYVIAAIGLIGLGSGLYLTCNLGPGPRDGWMTGIHQRTGWPVARVRMGIEVIVLTAGWLLGGTIGLGTLAFAALIGPSVGYGLRLAGRIGRVPGRPPSEVADADFPELDA